MFPVLLPTLFFFTLFPITSHHRFSIPLSYISVGPLKTRFQVAFVLFWLPMSIQISFWNSHTQTVHYVCKAVIPGDHIPLLKLKEKNPCLPWLSGARSQACDPIIVIRCSFLYSRLLNPWQKQQQSLEDVYCRDGVPSSLFCFMVSARIPNAQCSTTPLTPAHFQVSVSQLPLVCMLPIFQ